jgi:4-hydroxybenzoate polyprenyltransferase/phosphoserine phosphatase
MESTRELKPLVVDLDGTLTPIDTLHESFLKSLQTSPLATTSAVLSLGRGKGALKSALAALAIPNATTLPLRSEVLELIRTAKAQGRKVVLATGAHRRIAEAVAEHLGLFDEVLSTGDDGANLVGPAKANRLKERFGAEGFDYVGDSSADIEVWKIARTGHCVGSSGRFRRFQSHVGNRLHHLPSQDRSKPAWKILRPHQWVKNFLVFLPIATDHRIFDAGVMLQGAIVFFAFCMAASMVYVLNDLVDRESDRKNPSKATRPIASGALSIPGAFALATTLASTLAFTCLFLPWQASVAIVVYLVANGVYSLHVKRRLLADVFLLAFMYVWRIETGSLATGIVASSWLLAFSGFLFLSLAFAKRYAEVARLAERGMNNAAGRAWKIEDTLPLAVSGIGCGVSGSIILSLYVTGESFANHYHNAPVTMLLSPLFLYWIIRIWVQACRLELHEDPITFAAKDKISYLVAAVGVGILFIAMI